MKSVIFQCIWLILLAQCSYGRAEDQSTTTTTTTTNLNVFDTSNVAKCLGESETTSVNELESASQVLVESCQNLALRLFKALSRFESKSNSNGLIFSPSSIWSTLLVTYLGSKGDTEKELKSKLKLNSLSKTSVVMAYRGIQMWQNLKGAATGPTNSNLTSSSKTQISDVNKIFVSDRLRINSCFRDIFPEYLDAKDFASHSAESMISINEWVKNQTSGMITDLLPSGSITSGTKLVIANAVSFKSPWAHQFDASKTKKDKFFVSPEETIEADMMSIESANLLYGVSEALQATAVEIPYSNQEHSMVVILPSANKGLDSLLRDLTVENLQELLRNMVDDDINLVLPKFKAEQEFELAGPLYSVGFKKVFDPRYVDLSTIFADEQDRQSTALNSVLHKSFIKVNEEGTEAAAATALIFARSGRPLFPTQFHANRPFLYLVRDSSTNMVLFIGTVRRPQAE